MNLADHSRCELCGQLVNQTEFIRVFSKAVQWAHIMAILKAEN